MIVRADENTQPDHAVGIASVTPWHVKNVRPLADFRLEVKFADGTQGLVDMARLLARDCGVFGPLRELSLFNQVYVDDGVVTWPGGLDLDPDTMHEELGKAGVYVIR
jgi:hypothetical protein